MGFISFNENYYRRKLEEYENKNLSDADICEAKQLLKVLDDLTDEGYTNLNDRMEADFSCLKPIRTDYSAGIMRISEDLKRCIRRTFSCSIPHIAAGCSM